jgi:hypothetical protein
MRNKNDAARRQDGAVRRPDKTAGRLDGAATPPVWSAATMSLPVGTWGRAGGAETDVTAVAAVATARVRPIGRRVSWARDIRVAVTMLITARS